MLLLAACGGHGLHVTRKANYNLRGTVDSREPQNLWLINLFFFLAEFKSVKAKMNPTEHYCVHHLKFYL